MIQITLSKWQNQVFQDPHRFRVVCAGRRCGKTVLSEVITLDWAIKKRGLYWIVSPTYKQSKMIHWREIQKLIPREWIVKKNEVELSIVLKNGATIELKGAENPDALRGVKLRGLVIDEIASVRNWDWLWSEVLRPTLTDYEAPSLFISTPKGFNHFYELYQQGQADGQYKSWKFTSYDNPYIPSHEIDLAAEEVGKEIFAQEYLAEFTHFTGLIYKEFDADKHVHYFDHEFNQWGDYYFGLDFAVRGWTAMLCSTVKPDGHIYHLDEYKVKNLTAEQHSQAIIKVLEQYAPLTKWTGYADPAGWQKNQQKGDMLWAIADEYIDAGLPIVPGNHVVAAGINYVRQLHRKNQIHVHPRCIQYVEEKSVYQWAEQPLTQMGTVDEPEHPRKINDHIMDCERYEVYSKPPAADEAEQPRTTVFPGQFVLKLDEPDPNADQFEEIDIPSIFED